MDSALLDQRAMPYTDQSLKALKPYTGLGSGQRLLTSPLLYFADSSRGQKSCKEALPGTLPASASTLSTASRGLLVRLLERDPRVRLRSLRQLQQSAFYMSYNFEHVKAKKVSDQKSSARSSWFTF